MIILDSNIWIGYFYDDDPHHDAAQKIFDAYELKDIIATEYIILEVMTILKQKKGYDLACKFLNFIEDFDIFVIESQEKHLSFVDVSLLVLSEDYTVMTFDKHLKKLIKR